MPPTIVESVLKQDGHIPELALWGMGDFVLVELVLGGLDSDVSIDETIIPDDDVSFPFG